MRPISRVEPFVKAESEKQWLNHLLAVLLTSTSNGITPSDFRSKNVDML